MVHAERFLTGNDDRVYVSKFYIYRDVLVDMTMQYHTAVK